VLVALLAAVPVPAVAGEDHPTTQRTAHGQADIGPFRGVATGLTDRYRLVRYTSPDGQVTVTFKVTGRFVFTFSVKPDGRIVGRGNGAYTAVDWRLNGTFDGKPVGCNPAVSTTAFTVDVGGRASAGVLNLDLEIVGAREFNGEYPCPGDYFKALAADTSRLAEGLETVIAARGGSLRASQVMPTFPLLSTLEQGTSSSEDHVFLYEWRITIQAPPAVPPEDNDPGTRVGGVQNPRSPAADACTIKGTTGNDVLVGTQRADVICGFGGNDRIYGKGGNDIVYGGLGNDWIAGGRGNDILRGNRGSDALVARDGVRDRVDGGPGLDTGNVDRLRDVLTSIERRT
jgi:Ca2+-binding RTX toxin-like protein